MPQAPRPKMRSYALGLRETEGFIRGCIRCSFTGAAGVKLPFHTYAGQSFPTYAGVVKSVCVELCPRPRLASLPVRKPASPLPTASVVTTKRYRASADLRLYFRLGLRSGLGRGRACVAAGGCKRKARPAEIDQVEFH